MYSGIKINKRECVDKSPYTVYYPHIKNVAERCWDNDHYHIISVDPASTNYALRIEKRYHNGWIRPVVFDKVSIKDIDENDGFTLCNTFNNLTNFLDKYKKYYNGTHFVVIERQLPQNYKATRIAQHTISYFSIILRDCETLPTIIEVDPKLKGKMLGAPQGINDRQLKSWAIVKASELLVIRKDDFSQNIMKKFKNKQDDLADTICQIEALFVLWGMLLTVIPPNENTDDTEKKSVYISIDEICKTIVPFMK